MKARKQAGFTLVELSFVVLILGILAVSYNRFILDNWRKKKTDITAAEVWTIGTAAQKYSSDLNTWPDQANSCAGAFAILIAQGYLANIDQNLKKRNKLTCSQGCNKSNSLCYR